MQGVYTPTPFDALRTGDLEAIRNQPNEALTPFLPLLVRIATETHGHAWVLPVLAPHAAIVHDIARYLQMDAGDVGQAAWAELHAKRKLPADADVREGSLVSSLGDDLVADFERADARRRSRLFLSDLLNASEHVARHPDQPFTPSAILSFGVFLTELEAMLPVLAARLDDLLTAETVTRGLLGVPNGPDLLFAFVCNQPQALPDVLRTSLNLALEAEVEDVVIKLFSHLATLSPYVASLVRERVATSKIFPGFALAVTLDHLDDVILFLCSQLHDKNWLWSYIQREYDLAKAKTPAFRVRASVLTQVEAMKDFDPDDPSSRQQAASLMLAVCGLVALGGVRITVSEAAACMQLVRRARGERTVTMAWCFALVCPFLLRLLPRETILDCLSILNEAADAREWVLLIAIYMHAKQDMSVVETVRAALGFQAVIHTESLKRMADLVTSELLTDRVVVQRVLQLSPIKHLRAGLPCVSLLCLSSLLRARVITQQEVDVGDWVFEQVCNAITPIHSLLPTVVQELVSCTIPPTPGAPGFFCKRWTEERIGAVFHDRHKYGWAVKMLVAFYVLYFNSQVIARKTDERSRLTLSGRSSMGFKTGEGFICEYSQDVLASIPFKILLSKAAHDTDAYGNIYPPFLSLLVSLLPQLFFVPGLLFEEEITSRSGQLGSVFSTPRDPSHVWSLRVYDAEKSTPSPQQLDVTYVASVLAHVREHPEQACHVLRILLSYPPEHLRDYAACLLDLVLPAILTSSVPHYVALDYASLWQTLYTMLPRDVGLKTVNAFQSRTSEDCDPPYTHADLVADPLLVLRCDPRVFRNPVLLQMLLQDLHGYMMASRKFLSTQSRMGTVVATKQEELNTIMLTQDSAICQILLETCLKRPDESEEETLFDIRRLICAFLHQLFIENPLLIKLLHFQGYPTELLPVTVADISSMHICVDFLPELLSQPHLKKQAFAVCLGSQLAEKYPLPNTLAVSHLILSRLRQLLHTPEYASFIPQSLDALVQLAGAFPTLTGDVVDVLGELARSMSGTEERKAQVLAAFTAVATRVFEKGNEKAGVDPSLFDPSS